MPRQVSSMEWEAARATLSMAGIRLVSQAVHTATSGANTSYTVLSAATRRVICCHLGTGNGDIRVNYNAAAAATSMPLLPARYFSVDAQKADTIQFWNTSGGDITINVMEVE